MQPLSRRGFLRAGGALLLGAAATACGSGRNGAARATASGGGTFDAVLAGRQQSMELLVPGFETLSGIEQRLVVALFATRDQTQYTGGTARAWVAKGRHAEALGPFPLTFRGEGLGDRGAYIAHLRFPSDGDWDVLVEAQPSGVTQTLVGVATTRVGRTTPMPKQGDKAISVPTPTARNHRGVEPYCTADPPCPMHEISLDRALASGKPTVMIIATPAFCASRLCGPEVELLADVARDVGDRAHFVHVEVYANDKPETITRHEPLSPAAKAWKLYEEPAVYWIASDGTIAQRFIGPVDRGEFREETQKLLAG